MILNKITIKISYIFNIIKRQEEAEFLLILRKYLSKNIKFKTYQ